MTIGHAKGGRLSVLHTFAHLLRGGSDKKRCVDWRVGVLVYAERRVLCVAIEIPLKSNIKYEMAVSKWHMIGTVVSHF